MSEATDSVIMLNRALDQMGDLIAAVHEDQLGRPTPCSGWAVGQLVAHVLAGPRRFLEMAEGGEPDFSTNPAPPEHGWAETFRESADDLIHHWHQEGEDASPEAVDWQTAEFALHGYDLAKALGRRTDRLDPEVAERGYAYMSRVLTPDNRGQAFAAEQQAPADADPYERLAAFAGREVA
ncbi:TIGR03086 family metal-binding protein [Nocardioides coralli]|uniref:TIGR03086 family metal-binding protein n=1 Tax=Nocardioides coralli TaxID=2872154 RepID=UPI001CA43055|nr:TIGR03086 family metal-binding protein [Nocardioides coralli]QZY30091.1 TIGR03086 family protein [Nocardioides coralli]